MLKQNNKHFSTKKKNMSREDAIWNDNYAVNNYIEDCLDNILIKTAPNHEDSLLYLLDNVKDHIHTEWLVINNISLDDFYLDINVSTDYDVEEENIEDTITIGDGVLPLGQILNILNLSCENIQDYLEA